MKTWIIFLTTIFMFIGLSACSQSTEKMQDGYYTAESVGFDAYGWKPFITIYVSSNKLTTIEYNAKDASGFIKSWDVDWMRKMKAQVGTYPNKYSRAYAEDLLNKQDPSKVNPIPGTASSYDWFKLLAEAAIKQSKSGDKKVAFVDLPDIMSEKE